MKFLLDEDVPVQLVEPLYRLLREHQVDHVQDLGWKGKKDRFLLPDANAKGYDALITNGSAQLDSAEETRAIRDSGMHHIRFVPISTQLHLHHRALLAGQHHHRIGPVLRRRQIRALPRIDPDLLMGGHLHVKGVSEQLSSQRRPLPEHLDQHFVQTRRP